MASIKDVAQHAGVSVTTVSIVINGQAAERKISEETQNRIWEAIRQLNYQPNLSARCLRSASADKKTIALYWTTDFREVMCSRFLAGLNQFIQKQNLNYDIVVHTYKNDMLSSETSLSGYSDFNGAIIATATPTDIAFLELNPPPVPVVLYNRYSEKFSNVIMDDIKIGQKAAEAFAKRGHKNIGLVCAPYVFEGMRLRDLAFIEACSLAGLTVTKYELDTINAEHGYLVSSRIDFSKISGIYLPSDTLAIGMRRFCYEHGIRIPDDLSILAIGNGMPVYNVYAVPSLSVIDIPMEIMAEKALRILVDTFAKPGQAEHTYDCVDTPLIVRESIKTINNQAT